MAKLNICRHTETTKMVNALVEVSDLLVSNGLTLDDVVFLYVSGHSPITDKKTIFKKLDIEYSYWYGDVIIDPSLIIGISDGSRLIRWATDDGMEGFTYEISGADSSCCSELEIISRCK